LTFLAGIALFVLSTLAIELLLGGGAFDAEDVERTAGLLSVFALSVPIESLTYPLARAIYATRNTVLPVSASLAGLGVTILATLILRPALGLTAIPLAFALGSATKLTVLAIALPFRIRQIPELAAVELSETR
jgi:putative peptidoglycan lipid II flippase